MNIFTYFQRRGIDTIDSSFYRKIDEWNSWYVGNVRNFSFYKVYSGKGVRNKVRRKSLQMAKKLCEDMANLLLNEKVTLTVQDEATNDFVKKVLEKNRFYVLGNEYQERKSAGGTVAYVPYIKDGEVDSEGRFIKGSIGINYVTAPNIFPISWENRNVTEVAFTFPKTVNRRKYIHVQSHTIGDDGNYIIENAVLEAVTGSKEGKELTREEWQELKPFRNLAERILTGSPEPQFVIDTLNIVNNADENDSTNPMGIALYANCIDTLKKIDIEFDSYASEFILGRKRIFAAPELMHDTATGELAFDPDDMVFYMLPGDYAESDKKPLYEVNMDIRAEAHSKAISDDLNMLSIQCGFGTERYRFEGGGVKTATEVISINSEMYRTLVKHEIVLHDVLIDLCRIIIRLGIALGNNLSLDSEININFDDSIIEDKEAERTRDRADVGMNAMQLYEYRMKWYGETEEQAKAAIVSDSEVID